LEAIGQLQASKYREPLIGRATLLLKKEGHR
jgi:hypothetical protein